jgi:hypothetical protein
MRRGGRAREALRSVAGGCHKPQQQASKLLALRLVERCQQLVLDLLHHLPALG